MEIEVEQSKLAKALSAVSRVAAGARTTLPVLSNVLIRVDKKKTTLTTTNLDMAVEDFLPTSLAKDGVVTVPAKLLSEFVANLPGNEVVNLSVKGDKVVTRAGKYSSVMNGTSAEDFPELPEIDEKKAVKFKIGVEEFRAGLTQVMVASSNDLTRPSLTGVYFNTNDGALYVAATDGYRLAEKKLIDKVKSEVKAIVPSSSLAEVMRLLGDNDDEVEIIFDDAQVKFRLGEIELTSKLIDGSFPDYRRLIPEKSETILKLDRAELSRVTKLAALFAREAGGSIICEAKEAGVFSVSSVANEFGENDSEITVKVTKPNKVTLNARYLIDALNVLSDTQVIFRFSGGLAPIVVTNAKLDDYTHIIMPLKGKG